VAEAAPSLKLIVGLGNPGTEYARTRHNAGWWLVDALAEQHRAVWRTDRRRHLMVSQIGAPHSEPWLIKPTSFMNCSGAPVAEFAAFYRIAPPEILVVHDEIDLPPGTARLKYGGGHGGHNGVRDVMAHIGPDFWRLRLGVGHPGDKDLVIDAVLDRPSAEEQLAIDAARTRALEIMPELLAGQTQRAIHRLHNGNPKAPSAPSSATS